MRNYYDYYDRLDEYPEENGYEVEEEGKDEETMDDEEGKPRPLMEGEHDPIKIYLKEMGGVPLLTKDGEIEIAKKIEQGKEKVARIIFSLPFALKKLIVLGKMVEIGEAPLEEIIQNGEDEAAEDLIFERKRFFNITLEIKSLYQKRKLLLKKFKEAGNTSQKRHVKALIENREHLLDKVRQLRLRDDVLLAFSEELKKVVISVEELHRKIVSARKKARYLGVDIERRKGRESAKKIKNKAVMNEINQLIAECSNYEKEVEKKEDLFGINYEEMKIRLS